MGYVLSLWAAPVTALDGLLRSGPADPAGRADAVESWLDAEAGSPVGTVDHSSSAGSWFRDDVIGDRLAARVGGELAGHLIARPLAGVDWDGYPSVGWASNAELRSALARDPGDAGDPDSEEGETAQEIVEALARVRDAGQDLVTFYA